MKNNWKLDILFWVLLLACLSCLFIIQTSFWPKFFQQYNIIPQFTLPVVIYFFINRNLSSSLLLTVLISLIARSFTATPLLHLFIFYITICMLIKVRQKIYFRKTSRIFFEQIIFWSWFFSYLFQILFYIDAPAFYLSVPFMTNLLNAIITCCVAVAFYPFLEKYLKQEVSF